MLKEGGCYSLFFIKMCNPNQKTEPKKEEYLYVGSCVTGGIVRVSKQEMNRIKTFCEEHNGENKNW